MQIQRKDVANAAKAGLITAKQAESLWQFWNTEKKDLPSFRFVHILYYLGGMIAISAVTLYVTNAWDKLKGWPLLTFSICLLLLGFALTHYFLRKKLRLPAGIFSAFSLAIVPLIVYNIQFLLKMAPNQAYEYSDFHYWVDWYWLNMEIATLLVGIIMFYFYRFSFLLFPIAIILWYMSMDLWPWLLRAHEYTPADHAVFTMFFGLIILAVALYVDFKFDDQREDYAFWLYLVGVITFWGGLSSQYSISELSKFFYCLINVVMLFISAILNRRVFAVFGALGILGYLSHLAFDVFANSLGFPVALIIIGVLIIFAAAFFTRMESKLNSWMRPYIPKKILKKMQA